MPLPNKVRIAHVDFEIQEWPPRAANASHRWGQLSVSEMLIHVQVAERSYPEVVCTLLHEIGHAIYWAYELQDGDKEERIVSVFAVAWAQVYRDNPEVIQFIEGISKADHVETMDEYAARKRREIINASKGA